TRVFDRQGNIAGDFYKQHLPNSEKRGVQPDYEYTKSFAPPAIVEVDGIRLGFLICYDTYFNEYIARLAAEHPDMILVSSFQRGERQDILRMLNQNLAFQCNSHVLRASVSMGPDADVGGTTLAVAPDGRILGDFGNRTGTFTCSIGDIHRKHVRANAFGGEPIANDAFIANGRTPWAYRSCGSMVIPGEADHPYPRLCAHRGFSAALPENTMAAFGAAIALGAPEIELDVRFSRDGVPVVCHDDVLDRVSNGSGLLCDKTFAELRELDFGIHAAPSFAGTRIASFEDVLAQFSRQTIINLHIKSSDDREYPESQFRKILELLRRYDQMEHVYLMASPDVMSCALRLAPEIPRCMSAGVNRQGRETLEPWEIVERAIDCRCSKVQLFTPYYDQALIDKAHANGLRCNFFFSDTPEEARQLLAMGVDTLLTNNYQAIARALAMPD
ncbi:MAG: hypothetical protein IJC73_03120, partial [Lentisphaeria bacterium]|nr:hypothetical protein [Lentisphaeria bacterium]